MLNFANNCTLENLTLGGAYFASEMSIKAGQAPSTYIYSCEMSLAMH